MSNNASVEMDRAAKLREERDDLHTLTESLREAIAERKRLQVERQSWATVVEPGRAVLDALHAVRVHTPKDAWITSVKMLPRQDHLSTPKITVTGKIRESTKSVSDTYDQMAEKLEAMSDFAFSTKALEHDESGGNLEFTFDLVYLPAGGGADPRSEVSEDDVETPDEEE